MKYLAKLIAISENHEREVVLRINGFDLTCFVVACPYKIEKGNSYLVDLTCDIFDKYEVAKVDDDSTPSIWQSGKNFSCTVTGKLQNGAISVSGIKFEDDLLRSDFSLLEEKMVKWRIDSLNVDFL